ncbi:hypothetical protein KAFR_0A02570 [Kazachstania africana CBS 2517]|uniref:F-actin-capping protein subunit beta n=1 Tax=Kazachstania africana (strain ATCC 22294 / BCRC 22015 / CBS 2517 / CECT 1963 / NBRC 1671 / NRRL Y-8276) TaxID=1071382 RepID=H2AMU3_KAZAF|nr:hypothetical protein KAFR_0A02570 [Kazachstania africana CBS 2517]CCF55693.1 hypothetical protein KAFR_0A02570 [Kazachstania africana CBS 2517]
MSSEGDKYDAALDLLRRLNPVKINSNLQNVINLEPTLAEDLLSSIDVPLKISNDPGFSNREYLCCDYNRDLDSFRSPWSNEYFPKLSDDVLMDSPFPSESLRQLEILCNDSFDVYRDLYYEGGVSSVYLWDLEDDENAEDFAGVVLFKKSNKSKNHWDSVHVVEVVSTNGNTFQYKVTTTIILQLEKDDSESQKLLRLSGNLTRQTEKTLSVDANSLEQTHIAHVTNLGVLIEDVESQMRNLLETVYFEKTRDIFHQVRNGATIEDQLNQTAHAEVIKGLQNL